MNDELRQIPSVDKLLSALPAGFEVPHARKLAAARKVLEDLRLTVRAGEAVPNLKMLAQLTKASVESQLQPSLRRVINASGVILQTNLGRAPLSEAALNAMRAVGGGYSNLEFDLEAGERGGRHDHAGRLIRETTGAEDGIVVNNNAAALFFVLSAFTAGRDVIVSRGQAVEIGGGFRIPDVLRQSGARLVEVGTTNRTYARDYAEAATGDCAAILRVHTSNFQVVGFTAEPALSELADVAHRHEALLIDDLGSGCLIDTATYGLRREPTVRESIEAGADLVLFSGDKLLGGPQCGIIAGRKDLVATLKRHPLARALRVDKTTVAALEATLLAYFKGTERTEIPIWRMLAQDLPTLRRRAMRWQKAAGSGATVVVSRTMVGGGSLPGDGVPTWCAALQSSDRNEAALANSLRLHETPIVARVEDGRVLLDPRTVDPGDDRLVAAALAGYVPQGG